MPAAAPPPPRPPGTLATMARNSAIFAAGEIALKAMSALLAPLFTVLLSPHEFGVWSLGVMIQSLLAPLFGLGLHGAVTRLYYDSDDPQVRDRLQGTVTAFLFAWGGTLSVAIVASAPWWLPKLLPSFPVFPLLPLVVATVLLSQAATVRTASWTAAERAGLVVSLRSASNAVYLLLALALVAGFGAGVVGIFWARLAGAATLALPLLWWSGKIIALHWDRPVLRAALVFSLPLVPHLLAHWVLALSDRSMIEYFLGTAAVGVYSAAYVFTDAVNMVAVSVNGAFIPLLNRNLDRKEGDPVVARAVGWFAAVVLAMSAASALLGPPLVRLVFDARYHGAAEVAGILGGAGAMQGLYYVWVSALFFRKQSGRVPLLTIVGGAVNVGLNWLWIPRFGIAGAAWATALGYAALLAGVAFAARLGGGLPVDRRQIGGLVTGYVAVLAGGYGVHVALGGLVAGRGGAALVLVGECVLLALAAALVWRLRLLHDDDRAALRRRFEAVVARLR